MKKVLLLAAFCLLVILFAQAQPPPPPPPGPLSGADVPFDNEVFFLLSAVSLFGAYKIYKSKSAKPSIN